MTRVLHARRQRQISVLAIIAGVLFLALVLTGFLSGREQVSDRKGQPVLPGLSKTFDRLTTVRVRLPDSSYTLEKTENGWGLVEAGGYPVRPDRVAALIDGLSELTFEAPRTRDPDKYDSLGLGDPESGGTGARVTILAAGNDPVVDLIAGRRRDTTYVREPGNAQSWRVSGDLPPLYARSEWLDLDWPEFDPDNIVAVQVQLVDGAYALARQGENWLPVGVSEGRLLASRFGAVGPALALSRPEPSDVRRLTSEFSRIGTHVSRLTDGREISVTAYRAEDGSGWISLSAAGLPDRQFTGWVFRIAPQDFADFTAPDAAILLPEDF